MKIFILFALIAVAYADYKIKTGADLPAYRSACQNELKLSDEVIAQYKQWKFEDDTADEYIHCFFKQMELFNDDEGFNVDNLVAQLGQGRTDDIRPAIEKCNDQTIADLKQRAFNGFKCFSKSNLSLIKSSVSN